MRRIFSIIIFVLMFFIYSCGGEPDDSNENNDKKCYSQDDCQIGYTCDLQNNVCVENNDNGVSLPDTSDSGDDGNTGDSGNSGNSGNTGSNTECTPKETQKCNYQSLPETEGIGPCKASVRTCGSDGTWGPCEGEVLPEVETGDLCSDGIDNDCDGTIDNGTDIDGDGHPACEDCCEVESQCPDPKSAWDPAIHFCSHDENENSQIYKCDDTLNATSKDPMDYARAIGLCKTATEDAASGWGVISAEILKPDGSFGANIDSNGMLNALGNVIKPTLGSQMLAITSGKVGNPMKALNQGVSSAAPSDWYGANGNKYPSSPSCGGSTGTTGNTYDSVMLKLRIRVPEAAKSFSFNLYFLTIEYPTYICSQYNDFFVALLDSTYTSDNPEFQNPADKNLGRDALGNPVGVNLAPAGLFKQCVNATSKGVTSCIGTEELQGTGFESSGGTGWLITRGNVVPGEVITLRLAIWDLGDHALDSMSLIDNFKWEFEEYKPGTGAE
ncbi:MAG TPA: choice-of-anchor L domain-containing protein [bacterium]|nr:choice-of-anchor L domain-containing protein [bacterium]